MENGSGNNLTAPAKLSNNHLKNTILLLAMGALGVVYGDIGTSPLYAFRECFNPDPLVSEVKGAPPVAAYHHGVIPNPDNVMGVLSLIFWSLVLVVMVKYFFVVMRADNEGEGGIFALMARVLARGGPNRSPMGKGIFIMLGLVGTALFAANGVITPSISVLSAVEGLEVAAPGLKRLVIPITIGILIALFIFQKRGTAVIGSWFGPVMLVWFLAIAAMGAYWIAIDPSVVMAVNPYYAFLFFFQNSLHGLVVLGAVILCLTGCEALYADLGHFGLKPISLAWYVLVFPCTLLNYFGQGAMILNTKPELIGNPFFDMAPKFLLYPVVVLATVATVIASQALISGMFSLARQAVQLNYLPRLNIVHTSETMHGQIYLPEVNTWLGVACIALVLGFRNSSDMATAYGIAVIGTMAMTSLLMFWVEREQWGWKLWQALAVTGAFLAMDAFFLVGNLSKILLGGWFTIAAGLGVFAVMTTWRRGYEAITKFMTDHAIPVDDFVKSLEHENIPRVKGTALFVMSQPDVTPRVLLHHLKHIKMLHEQVLLMSVHVEDVPSVPAARRVELQKLDNGFEKVMVHCGFMQNLDMREIIRHSQNAGLKLAGEISYFIGHMTLKATGRIHELPLWRKVLFAFLFNNERSPTIFLGIPPNRVVELGEQAEM